jgi:hypothetical protein|tara:strand:- start:1511 stop:5401 length:3891 start_codon:yes stop_codon:yes gene_type:complete
MEITVPKALPFNTGGRLPKTEAPTLGETGNAQYGKIFNPIKNQLNFYTRTSTYDPDSQERIEDFIKVNELNENDARYLRSFGIGSPENFSAALKFIENRRKNYSVLNRSTGLNLFVTDPSLHVSLGIPAGGILASKYLKSTLANVSQAASLAERSYFAYPKHASSILQDAARAKLILRNAPVDLAKLGALDAAVVEGSISLTDALSEISEGEDPVEELTNAALWTMGSTAIGGTLGYTLGLAVPRPQAAKTRKQNFNNNYKDYLKSISENPLNRSAELQKSYDAENINNKKFNKVFDEIKELENQLSKLNNALQDLDIDKAKKLANKQKKQRKKIKTETKKLKTELEKYGKENQRILKERENIKEKKGKQDISYSGDWFTNSWFMKAVPTPVRTTIQDKKLPDFAKEEMLDLGGDNGMPFIMNQIGKSAGNSAFTEIGRRQGDWFQALDVINRDYRKVSPRGFAEFFNVPVGEYYERIRRKIGKDSFAPDEWYTRIGQLMIDEVPYEKMTPEEASSVQAARTFFEKYAKELEEEGLINAKDVFEDSYLKNVGRQMKLQSVTQSIIAQNKKWMTPQRDSLAKDIEKVTNKLKQLNRTATTKGLTKDQVKFKKDLEDELVMKQDVIGKFDDAFDKINNAKDVEELALLYNQLDLTPLMRSALKDISKAIDETRGRIDNALELLERGVSKESTGNYLMRIFNRRAIEADRDGFKAILYKWFKENNEVIVKGDDGLFKFQELSTEPAAVERRVNETIENILGETDEDAIDAIFTGFGRSGPLVSRRLNIPNALVKDFIVTDIKELMIAYTNRVAPRIEYHKRFRNPETGKIMTLEARLDYYRTRLQNEGVDEKTINKFIKNFVAVYDQVVGTKLKRPDAIDTKIADFLRTATSWTFLGGSGFAAVADSASILMDHELNAIGRTFLGMMDDLSLKMAKRELNLAGEALEFVRGTTHLKYMESLTNDVFSKTIPDKLNNVFYTFNGLGPVTVAIKTLDGLLRGHTIIDSSLRLVAGKPTKFDTEFLARYNITPDLARRITESPYEQSQGKLYLPNTEAWTDEEAVKAFRNALNSGVMNRVIMGTPADKPIVMGGVAYIPESLARTLPFDLPIDPRVQGYRRVESGLLSLPFTFYSYTMGALSKITANHASGSVRNRLSHVAAAMGLGYMIVSVRTPNWAWDDMDIEDKIMRSFDFSGLAAIYSDMGYRALAMYSEMGFENNFPIQPKFQADPDPLGALVSIGGSPADWSYEVITSLGQMIKGDVQDGAKGLIKVTPLIETLVTGDIIKDTAKDAVGFLPNRP